MTTEQQRTSAPLAEAPAPDGGSRNGYWQACFHALELELAEAAVRAAHDESTDVPGVVHWSGTARKRQHLLEEVHRLQAHVFARQESWSIGTPPPHQLLEAWASLTEAAQRCADHDIDARELREALRFVEELACAGGFRLHVFAELLDQHGPQLDALGRLLEALWNNPGDLFEDWRPRHAGAGHLRFVSASLEEGLLRAEAQLDALQAMELGLRPAVALLDCDGLLTGADDPAGLQAPDAGTPSARLATARIVLRAGEGELVAHHRARVVQVFDELFREKRRQMRLLQTLPTATAGEALREAGMRFADLVQLTAPQRRDPLLAAGAGFRVGCHALGLAALVGAAMANRRGALLPVLLAVGVAVGLTLLAAWSRRASARFQMGLLSSLLELDEQLGRLELRLQAR